MELLLLPSSNNKTGKDKFQLTSVAEPDPRFFTRIQMPVTGLKMINKSSCIIFLNFKITFDVNLLCKAMVGSRSELLILVQVCQIDSDPDPKRTH